MSRFVATAGTRKEPRRETSKTSSRESRRRATITSITRTRPATNSFAMRGRAMTGESALPEKGAKGRSRLRAEWRAETTWRRHEIAGRLKDLQRGLNETNFKKLLDRVEKVLSDAELPITVRRKLEASVTIEHEKPSLEEPKEDDKGT